MRWFLATALGVLLVPSGAWAQMGQIQFVSRSGGSRNVTSADRQVGRSDCASNEIWRFRVTLLTATTSAPEIWVGNTAACESTNREPSVTATCWQVCGGMRQTCDVMLGSGLMTYEFSIPASRLIDPTQGNCSRSDIPNRTGGVGNSYLLMIVNNEIVATYTNTATTNAIQYDVVPPEAPTGVTALAGESQVNVRWNYATSTTTTDADGGTTTGAEQNLNGFYVLCDPPNTAAGDGGTDGGIAPTDAGDGAVTCGTSGFTTLDPNNAASFAQYRCRGTDIFTAVTRSAQVGGLSNGTYTRFAVVAEDLAGNRSSVSALTLSPCVAPGPITDFWEYYRERGGRAQPAYCATRPGRKSDGTSAVGFGLAACAALVALRRRGK